MKITYEKMDDWVFLGFFAAAESDLASGVPGLSGREYGEPGFGGTAGIEPGKPYGVSVSYTHLDVYKRQLRSRSLRHSAF